ncbi:conserved hypothetical protein [delta proteobacterium NaphS2]|nr:conserved hypothetical protein [delta proteobacterium NaphS2]
MIGKPHWPPSKKGGLNRLAGSQLPKWIPRKSNEIFRKVHTVGIGTCLFGFRNACRCAGYQGLRGKDRKAKPRI